MTNVVAFNPANVWIEASQWVDRLADPKLSESDRDAFETWMAASENNRWAFAEMNAVWHAEALSSVQDAVSPHPVGPSRSSFRHGAAAGLAARHRMGPYAGLGMAAGLVAAVAIGLWLSQPRLERHATVTGERRVVALADGSRITLAGDTTVAVGRGGRSRDVRLLVGEAFFEVTPDPTRPFVLITDSARVTVLGTRFNVDREGPGRSTVSVFEGKVRVVAPSGDRPIVMGVGETVEVRGGSMVASDVSLGTEPDWIAGWLDADDVPLSQVIRELNRYSRIPILADASVGAIRITGRFRITEPDRVLATLVEAYGVRVDPGTERIIIRPGVNDTNSEASFQ